VSYKIRCILRNISPIEKLYYFFFPSLCLSFITRIYIYIYIYSHILYTPVVFKLNSYNTNTTLILYIGVFDTYFSLFHSKVLAYFQSILLKRIINAKTSVRFAHNTLNCGFSLKQQYCMSIIYAVARECVINCSRVIQTPIYLKP